MSRKMPKQKPGKSKQTYATPWEFVRAVQAFLDIGDFYYDLAATRANSKGVFYYDKKVDTFTQMWDCYLDEWNWLNPEYKNIAPYVEKAYKERPKKAGNCVLVPASVGSNWWRDWVHNKAYVLLLNGRITFQGHTQPYPKDCVLLIYSPLYSPGYDVWEWSKESQGR